MAGKPFAQVQESLKHMLSSTYTYRGVFTSIIPYDSSAEIIRVPRDGTSTTARALTVENRINEMKAGGGTNFVAAFEKINELLRLAPTTPILVKKKKHKKHIKNT